MPIYASSRPTGGDGREHELCPAGFQQAVCCDVVDHGMVVAGYANNPGKKQHKISIKWLSEKLMSDGRPYMVSHRFTLSLHPQSALRQWLEIWRGRPFTEAEAEMFDVEKLIGANANLQIMHQQKPRGMFAEIVACLPVPAGMKRLTVPADYIRFKDRPVEGQAPAVPTPPAEDVPF